MGRREREGLRVLVANERQDRIALLAPVLAGLGHEVVVNEGDPAGVAAATERADVALVGRGESPERALEIIDGIVRRAACPVIALFPAPDPAFIKQTASHGVFAAIRHVDADDWQGALDIVLRRFTEYRDLEDAFIRRATTERAKGILMERHQIDERRAFALLRDHARAQSRALAEVASAVVDGQALLPDQGSGRR